MSEQITIDVYRSHKNGNKYLAVPHGFDVTKLQPTSAFDIDLRILCPFRSQQVLVAGEPHIGLNSESVIQQIGVRGYATFEASASITIHE